MDRAQPDILIVEDDAELAALYQFLLQQEGWSSEIIDHGRTALERLDTPPLPRLILLDLLLPQIDGSQILKKSRRLEPAPPVVVVSALGARQREESLRLGAQAYFPKPFDPHQLLNTLRALVPPSD